MSTLKHGFGLNKAFYRLKPASLLKKPGFLILTGGVGGGGRGIGIFPIIEI